MLLLLLLLLLRACSSALSYLCTRSIYIYLISGGVGLH
jgi:hypothetical protein